jgi:hypothetical protein
VIIHAATPSFGVRQTTIRATHAPKRDARVACHGRSQATYTHSPECDQSVTFRRKLEHTGHDRATCTDNSVDFPVVVTSRRSQRVIAPSEQRSPVEGRLALGASSACRRHVGPDVTTWALPLCRSVAVSEEGAQIASRRAAICHGRCRSVCRSRPRNWIHSTGLSHALIRASGATDSEARCDFVLARP